MEQTLTLLAAVTVGAGLVLSGVLLGGRNGARPTERRLDRALQILEADRARLLNLLLARTPSELAVLTQTSPAHAPAPDVEVAGQRPAAPGPRPAEWSPDPYEMDTLDDAALNLAR